MRWSLSITIVIPLPNLCIIERSHGKSKCIYWIYCISCFYTIKYQIITAIVKNSTFFRIFFLDNIVVRELQINLNSQVSCQKEQNCNNLTQLVFYAQIKNNAFKKSRLAAQNVKLSNELCGKYANRHFQLGREESSFPTPLFSNSHKGAVTCP